MLASLLLLAAAAAVLLGFLYINPDCTVLHKTNPNPYRAGHQHKIKFSVLWKETKRKRDGLEKVEWDLARARASIRTAAQHSRARNDSSSSINNKIYLNEAVFNRSYQEMEKRLKVYVYREGYPPLAHYGACVNIYSTEGCFINQMDNPYNRFVTTDAEKAHLFFIPFSVTMLVEYVYKPQAEQLCDMNCNKKMVLADYIRVVAFRYPYWNRSSGSDHFFLSCHDWAPTISTADERLRNNAIRVLCNANSSEGFVASRDVSLMEMNFMRSESARVYNGLPAAQRDLLAFFAGGRDHGDIRPILFRHWHATDPDIQVHESLTTEEYARMMSRARFCVCASGYEVASPRVVEAIYYGCVPIIISPAYVLPLSDVLNWRAFSLRLDVDDIPHLKRILQSLPTHKYLQLQSAVLQVQTHFRLHDPPLPADMFHMILHSVWLRRLNIRVPARPAPLKNLNFHA